MANCAVYCADIGSIARGHFAWCGRVPSRRRGASERVSGRDIGALVEAVATHLRSGQPAALGFECPLFVPIPPDSESLGRARMGESSRSWSAAAGAAALATGLVQVVWVLREIRRSAGASSVFLDWPKFKRSGQGLFLWEAFVSGEAKRDSHVADAKAGLRAFEKAVKESSPDSAVTLPVDTQAYSLLGAAVIRAGWSSDVKLLSEPCLVFKADDGRSARAV